MPRRRQTAAVTASVAAGRATAVVETRRHAGRATARIATRVAAEHGAAALHEQIAATNWGEGIVRPHTDGHRAAVAAVPAPTTPTTVVKQTEQGVRLGSTPGERGDTEQAEEDCFFHGGLFSEAQGDRPGHRPDGRRAPVIQGNFTRCAARPAAPTRRFSQIVRRSAAQDKQNGPVSREKQSLPAKATRQATFAQVARLARKSPRAAARGLAAHWSRGLRCGTVS